MDLFILALAVFVDAFVWDRINNLARAIAYGAAVIILILAFIVFLMLLSAG